MITDKLVNALLESALASYNLLERLEAKIDAQAIGKLRGAIRSLQTGLHGHSKSTISMQMALNSFTECAEYFLSMVESYEKEMSIDDNKSAVNKFLGLGRFVTGSMRDLIGVGGGRLNKELTDEAESLNYVNLFILSEIGRVACMYELKYDAKLVSQELELLRSKKFDVESEMFLMYLTENDRLPKHIKDMSREQFTKKYGSVVNYSDVRPMNDWDEMKLHIIEEFGNTLDEIKKKNRSGYNYICYKAGRKPNDLDDYVTMTLDNRDDGLVDRVLDNLFETKLLYWADKETMDNWVESYFLYAALISVLKLNNSPQNFLSMLESRGLS